MRFRLALSTAALTDARNTAAERLSPDSYCGTLPGESIDPGESQSFALSGLAPSYVFYVGLGRWDDHDLNGNLTCWQKKNWNADPNFRLLYLYVAVQVTNHSSGEEVYTLIERADGTLALRTPRSGDIPLSVSVDQDPIR